MSEKTYSEQAIRFLQRATELLIDAEWYTRCKASRHTLHNIHTLIKDITSFKEEYDHIQEIQNINTFIPPDEDYHSEDKIITGFFKEGEHESELNDEYHESVYEVGETRCIKEDDDTYHIIKVLEVDNTLDEDGEIIDTQVVYDLLQTIDYSQKED